MKDLVVVGGGPAGIVTAIRTLLMGFDVTLIERKEDITKITRACSAQFVLDENYECETIIVGKNNVKFTGNRFAVPYRGRKVPITDINWFSPNGTKVNFSREDKEPISVKFDKSELLRGLLDVCQNSKLDMKFGCTVTEGEDCGEYVRLKVSGHDGVETIETKKLVIAEGAGAALTGKFGLNEGRTLFGTPLVMNYKIAGTTGFEEHSWNQYYGNVYHPFAEVMVGPAVEGGDTVEVTVMGTPQMPPEKLFEKIYHESPLAPNFEHAEIVRKTGCSVKSYTPLIMPYKGNVLVVGDSAAHVEVTVQGALMCGARASNAVKDELEGKEGFLKYSKWWRWAFEFNRMDSVEFVKLYALLGIKANFSDEEIDYLFSLVEGERLRGDFSQFEVPKNFWRGLLKHNQTIAAERPELYERLLPLKVARKRGMF